MGTDFVYLNGDTVVEPKIFQRLLASPAAPITVTIDKKESNDFDDMKVHLKGEKLLDIGKTLPLERTDGEFIGMLLFRGDGPKLFTHYLDDIMHTPEGLKWRVPARHRPDRRARPGDDLQHRGSELGRGGFSR